MILGFNDYTKQRLDEDVWRFQNYYKFYQSNTYGKNDELDAFRVAYISSYIAYNYGDRVAKKQFDNDLKMNPEYNNETLREASMKIWNSRVGREVAKELKKYNRGKNLDENQIKSMLAYSISEKLYDDKMITSLNDNKNYDDFDEIYFAKPQSIEPSKPSDKVLEGSIEQNVAQNDNKQFADSNTDTRYEYIKTPCVGSYEVSGYTKKDGTEVDDYIRTCGAKHIRKVKKKSAADNYMDKNVTVQQPSEQAVPSVKNNDIGYKQIKNPDGSYKLEMGAKQTRQLKYSEIYNTPIRLTWDEKLQQNIAQNSPSEIPLFYYYKISLDLADGNIDTIKQDKYNMVTKFSDFKNGDLKSFIKEKIIQSRYLYPEQKDFEERINNSYIITVKEGSPLANQIINSNKLKEFISANMDDITSGKFKNKIVSFEFQKPEFSELFTDKSSLYFTLHNVDIYNIHVDKNDNVIMDFIDDYNYEHWEKARNIVNNIIVDINNRAYHQQLTGELQPYILHIPIKIKIHKNK